MCEESVGAGRQSFPVHSACSSSSIATDLVKGEHFVLVDLVEVIPGSSS